MFAAVAKTQQRLCYGKLSGLVTGTHNYFFVRSQQLQHFLYA